MPILQSYLYISCLLTICISIKGCVTTADTQRSSLQILPESQMIKMGEKSFADLKMRTPISKDARLREVIERVGRNIASASGKNYQWEFVLFDDSKTVNAFCLPGGKIGVYTGILKVAKSEAGLAAVLGHEVAHATLGHGNERVSQGILASTGLAAAEAVLGKSENKGAIMAGLGLGAQFGVLLPYSRSHESEADHVGAMYMAKAGYDPREASELWLRMSENGAKMPEFVSTHPDSIRRAQTLKKNQSQYLKIFESSVKKPNSNL